MNLQVRLRNGQLFVHGPRRDAPNVVHRGSLQLANVRLVRCQHYDFFHDENECGKPAEFAVSISVGESPRAVCPDCLPIMQIMTVAFLELDADVPLINPATDEPYQSNVPWSQQPYAGPAMLCIGDHKGAFMGVKAVGKIQGNRVYAFDFEEHPLKVVPTDFIVHSEPGRLRYEKLGSGSFSMAHGPELYTKPIDQGAIIPVMRALEGYAAREVQRRINRLAAGDIRAGEMVTVAEDGRVYPAKVSHRETPPPADVQQFEKQVVQHRWEEMDAILKMAAAKTPAPRKIGDPTGPFETELRSIIAKMFQGAHADIDFPVDSGGSVTVSVFVYRMVPTNNAAAIAGAVATSIRQLGLDIDVDLDPVQRDTIKMVAKNYVNELARARDVQKLAVPPRPMTPLKEPPEPAFELADRITSATKQAQLGMLRTYQIPDYNPDATAHAPPESPAGKPARFTISHNTKPVIVNVGASKSPMVMGAVGICPKCGNPNVVIQLRPGVTRCVACNHQVAEEPNV